METVGILGGTGPAGQGCRVTMASAGYDVVLGSRDSSRALEAAASSNVPLKGAITGASNEDRRQRATSSSWRRPGTRRWRRSRPCVTSSRARSSSRW